MDKIRGQMRVQTAGGNSNGFIYMYKRIQHLAKSAYYSDLN